MKKSELKTLVRTIVREEVAMAINEVITELKEPVVVENVAVKKPKRKKNVKEKKQYTKNSILNDVLNETANEDWPTMGGGTQTSQNMNNILRQQYGNLMNGNAAPQLPVEDINGKPVTDISDDLMNNLTKDYSGMLKSMETSAKTRRNV
jgi:hypothetical protein